MSHRVGQGIAQLLRANDAAGQSDGQLLRQFLAHRTEAPFVALMQRHGPMVLAVCRRILRNEPDAEDAFQATFLVLVRRADALGSRAVLGDWLHGVARRTALNAKRLAARRRVKELSMARPEAQEDHTPEEWLPLLDEALCSLPDKYRLPIMLCDLEGRTRREAAEQLGWPEGTVAGRQARGRAMLAERLNRRGMVITVGSLTAVITANSASACVSPLLALPTARAAISLAGGQVAGSVPQSVLHLAEGVIRSMVLSKMKLVAVAALVVAGIAIGAAVIYRDRIPEKPVERTPETVPRTAEAPRPGPPVPKGPRKLLDVATRQPRFEGEFCGWLSAGTVLLALPDPALPRGRLVRQTLSSGKQEALPELTKLYNLADGGSAPQVSPDGRWVLWWDAKIHDVSIYGARVDGSGHFRLPKAKTQWDNMYLLWMADGRRFVELVTPDNKTFTRALIRSVDKPEAVEAFDIPADSPLQAACCIAGTDVALAAGDRLIALPWSIHGFGDVAPSFSLGECGIGPGAKPAHIRTVSSPPETVMRCGAAISPSSDQIAWLAAKKRPGGGTIVSVWVSRMDGTGWREIGFQDAPEPDTGFGEHLIDFQAGAPGGLAWLPDGKTLSFFFKGDLYTVPAG